MKELQIIIKQLNRKGSEMGGEERENSIEKIF